MSKNTEVDMKDVELNELDLEKQPMTGGEVGSGGTSPTEKNGCVKVKVPDDGDVKFTGLSKEELMKVAGTPGWVRTRWILLALFWLGWAGMLAGAIVIIVQAPRCKPLPKMDWWNEGPIYQIWDLEAFVGSSGLKGLEDKIDSLNQLKVKGLVVGPLHTVQADAPATMNLQVMDPDVGGVEDLQSLLDKAHKKGISVVLDLTPNYKGSQPWFSDVEAANTAEQLKTALPYWIEQGVDGIQLDGVDDVIRVAPAVWTELKGIVQGNRTEAEKNRVLIGFAKDRSAADVSALLNSSGVDLLLPGVLQPRQSGIALAQVVQHLYSAHNQTSLGWSLGGKAEGHLATLVKSKLVQLYQMLLFTLPGTPVFNYGDEIGLESQPNSEFPKMQWDIQVPAEEKNETIKAEREQKQSFRSFFKILSDLRGKERSLLHGDYLPIHNDTTSLAFLRQWDQSPRFLAAFNWGDKDVALRLVHPELPERASVRLGTDPKKHEVDSEVDLGVVELGPNQAVLLQFPFIA